MKKFLKRNLVLVLGVSLPVLLIAALLLVHGISRLAATGPDYPVLYVSFGNYFGQHLYDFDINSAGRLQIAFRLPDDGGDAKRQQGTEATLALYDAHTGTLETFALETPDDPPPGERIEIDVPRALVGRVFSARTVAPDGYRLEFGGHRSGGLLREIFGTGGRSRHHRLVNNNGVSFRVPDVAGSAYAHHNAFIGWVVDENE